MIAADTSTWVAFLGGDSGDDVALLDHALRDRQVLMVPAVLTELLSDAKMPDAIARTLCGLPLIVLSAKHWELAGKLRARVLAKGRKARLGDSLIAQTCIDREVPLLTRDKDFRAFATSAALELVIGS